jgi:N-acetylglucosamine repressor
MQRIKGNLQLMKQINKAAILNLLHREDRLSRAEISNITHLSATTVSALVEELLLEGTIEEIGERAAVGAGRRAIALQINKKGGYVIGISLGNKFLICAVLDLHGDLIAEYKSKIVLGNEAITEQIHVAIRDCLEQANLLNSGSIKGIGIAAPGIIDETGETIIYSSYLKLSNLNLKSQLKSSFPGIPIQIVNDSNASAFAEHYNGVGKNQNHLLFFTINEGVGSGLILNSQIFSGYQGAAGEIGHIPVDPNGELCSCGKRGCIETIITTRNVLKKCQEEAAKRGFAVSETMQEMIARYENGEDWLDSIFDHILSIITYMIASFVNFISPEAIIIEGWMIDSEKFMAKLKDELESFPFPISFSRSRVYASTYRENGSLYGAANLMLKQIFKAASFG